MDKTIILTGTSGNLGQAVVSKFTSEGCTVLGTFRPGEETKVVNNDRLLKGQLDVTDEQASEEYVDELFSNYNIEAAVLTVGGFAMGTMDDTRSQEIEDMFSLNFFSAYNMVRPLMKNFKASGKGGQIILIGAKPGIEGREGEKAVSYSLSKSLLFHLADMINAGWKEHNVKATVVVPSIIDSPDNREAMPDSDFSKWVKPEDIAEVIWFACTEPGRQLRENVLKIYNKS